MKIENIAIGKLIPYARNSRTHPDAQVAQIVASIREFGFTNPVLIDADGGIIAGHARVMAARQLGQAKVPCIRLGHLTEEQKRTYIIADNRISLNAGWDEEMLALEFRDLMDVGFDLSITGFDDDELLRLTDENETGKGRHEKRIDPTRVLEVIVAVSSEKEQEKIFTELTGRGYKCRVLGM